MNKNTNKPTIIVKSTNLPRIIPIQFVFIKILTETYNSSTY